VNRRGMGVCLDREADLIREVDEENENAIS
jgi:hypothetical protein